MNLNASLKSLQILKKLYLTALFLSFNFFLVLNAANYTVKLTTKNVVGTSAGIGPGDTVFIQAGFRPILRLTEMHGDSLNPIIIINKGGLVEVANESNYGISLPNCSYFRLTGTGDPNYKYGIKISKTKDGSSGLGIDSKSTNYEVDHLEICNTGFAGIFAFTAPTCDLSANRGNFIQKDCSIHDNYIHHTGGEGLYIGHSFYTGYTKTCDSIPVKLYPHEIHGMKIYNNILDSCGWDGMQVGCVTQGCEVYNNVITNYGIENVPAQQSGLQVGAGTTGVFYNNFIMNGGGGGMMVFGLGNIKIYNNVIVNPGLTYLPGEPKVNIHGIFIDDRVTIPGAPFDIINNTIINPRADGIRSYSDESGVSKIWNNTIINPGSYTWYGSNYSKSFVNLGSNVKVDIKNCYFQPVLPSTVILEDLDDVYSYTNSLPLKDGGLNVTDQGITYDYFYTQRPDSGNVDIGAFEFIESPVIQRSANDSSVVQRISKKKNIEFDKPVKSWDAVDMRVYPNPSQGSFAVHVYDESYITKVSIRNLSGMLLHTENPFDAKFVNLCSVNKLERGTYLVDIETTLKRYTQKLIVL
jgi:hypothetical protein